MKKFAQTQTPQQQSFFVFAQTQHQQAPLFCIFFSREWSTGEGGFKNPKQRKSLLVLAILTNQNAIGAGDTLQLQTAVLEIASAGLNLGTVSGYLIHFSGKIDIPGKYF